MTTAGLTRTGLAILATVFVIACDAGAQEAVRPVQYLSISVQSLDVLAKTADDTGITLPSFLTPAIIQSSFGISGGNGAGAEHRALDQRRAAGVVCFIAPGFNVNAGEGMVFEIPVAEGAANLDSYVQRGAQNLPDHADTVSLNGMTLRRTPHYLFVSKSSGSVALADEADLQKLYATKVPGREAIAHINFNFKSFMRGTGISVDSLVKNQSDAEFRTGTNRVGYELGLNIAKDLLKSIDEVNTSLWRVGDQFELRLEIAPWSASPGKGFNRPGLPPGIVGRLDMAFSPLKSISWLNGLADASANNADKSRVVTPRQRQAVSDFVHRLAELILGGEAESIGLAAQGTTVVVYLVQQFDHAVNVEDRLQAVADSYNQMVPTDPGRSESNTM